MSLHRVLRLCSYSPSPFMQFYYTPQEKKKQEAKKTAAKKSSRKTSASARIANSAMNAVGREIGRSFTRGILGTIKKWF